MANIPEIILSDDEDSPIIYNDMKKPKLCNIKTAGAHEISSSEDESYETKSTTGLGLTAPVIMEKGHSFKLKQGSKNMKPKRVPKKLSIDKAVEKAKKELNRMNKPGECLKHVTVELDFSLMDHPNCSDLIDKFNMNNIEFRFKSNIARNIVTWTRNEYSIQKENGTLAKTSVMEEKQAMIICNITDFIIMTKLSKQGSRQIGDYVDLKSYILNLKSQYPNKLFTLVIESLSGYYRSVKARKPDRSMYKMPISLSDIEGQQKTYYPNQVNIFISKDDVDECLLNMLFETDVSYRCVEDYGELSQVLYQFTKAVAEIPFKRQRDTSAFDWYAEGDRTKTVKVDKYGRGCRNLWLQQLQQFNLVTIDTAYAVATKYPSPTCLIEAYASCSSEAEASLLLQDIPVRRGVGPLTSCRKIGPELSKKIHTFFTSLDGNQRL